MIIIVSLLDIMMPEKDGIEVMTELRVKKETPVIMLTAKGEEANRVEGFELGADDYIVKPFSPREVVLRVKAILKTFCSLCTFTRIRLIKRNCSLSTSNDRS